MTGLHQDSVLIRALIDWAGLSAAQVARKAKLDPKTIERPASGKAVARLSTSTIEKLADAFPKFPGWTTAGAAALATFDDPDPDLVPVREIDLSYGMGATYLDVPVTEEVHHFPRAWLRRYTRAAPDHLFFAQGLGDSMEPTLYDSDLLLIDSSQRHLNMSEKIWAIAYADCGMIKRLRPVPAKDGKDAGVEVWSDKKEISPFTAYDDELRIIGRVVAVQRKL
ncbi:MAG: S24 family peptidase [Erythrobacter sp.]|nr:S24 family peptidase [Erythrobacter sp.]MDZ4272944.1 S24 family peptidase [Erythrobacter sp.]